MGKLWGIEELADYLGVPAQTVYQWRSKGYGPKGHKIGKYVKFRPEDVHSWVEQQPSEAA